MGYYSPTFRSQLSLINASTTLLLKIIYSWEKYLPFIKSFTDNINYLPLIKLFTVNNYCLPLIFTVNKNIYNQ